MSLVIDAEEKQRNYLAARDRWDRHTKPRMEVTAENFAATRRDVPVFGVIKFSPLLTLPVMLQTQESAKKRDRGV